MWGLIGLGALLRPRSVGLAGRTLFPLGALCGLLLALVALASLAAPPEPELRRAGFLHLLIAHLGAIAILLSFGVMQDGSYSPHPR